MIKSLSIVKAYPAVSLVALVILAGGVMSLTGYPTATKILLSVSALLIAAKLSYGMFKTLRQGRYGIDILAVTAIISTVAVGEYWAAIVIVLMLTGGQALEDYAASRAQRELTALLERAPQTAHKIIGHDIQTIPLSQVRVGDNLLVKPGEVVPVDATLQETAAEFDESSLTGESLPVEHRRHDQLLSGSINGGEAVKITALKTSADSQYQQIIKLIQAAASTEAPFVRLADRYAVPFTLVSFAIAGISWAVSGETLRFAQVLVVATPCPLLLGAPIALISGMSRAAKHGVIIKSGGILERLAAIRSVAFDKTGTLTTGEPVISKIEPQHNFTTDAILTYAASAEQQSAHILARALINEASKRKLPLSSPTNLRETTAQGLRATINNKVVLIGKGSFLQQNDINLDTRATRPGETAVYIAIDGKFAGTISFRDQLRPESQQVMRSLSTLDIKHTIMLTGDTQATANRIAQEAGITDVHAECLPIDKVNFVKSLTTRPVLMVGDGVNDAPVLAVADVGMAMGARGSTAASETADVVVMLDDLTKSYQAIRIAKDTMHIALQSIWIGIAISVMLMLIAATGLIPAVVGAALQEIVDVIVILNALRAHGPWSPGQINHKHLQ